MLEETTAFEAPRFNGIIAPMSEAPHILRNREFRERNLQIMRERLGGETYSAIARRHGVTPTRIRGIILTLARKHQMAKRQPAKYPHWRLPPDLAAKMPP